jgi:cobalt-zinc-cadmium efflux system protein
MDHHHSHDHGYARHSDAPASFGAAFAIGTGLNHALVLAELGLAICPIRSL